MRTRHWGRRGLVGVVAVSLATAGAWGGASATRSVAGGEDQEELNVTMGGSSSSSSVFAYLTAQARIAGEVDGNLNINIRETGASSENIQLLRDGAVDFGLSGLSTVIQAQRGLGAFVDAPYEDLCLMMTYLKNGEFITVRADSGIETVEDLDGQAFAPSFQGSALYDNMLAYFAVLGIEVEVFDGSLEDIVNAMKDGRIVGFGKSGNGLGADASMLDVASSVEVRTLGFSQEQIDQIFAAAPENELLYQFVEVAPGSIYDNEEAFLTPVVLATYFTDSDGLTEDEQYRVTRALFESTAPAAEQTNYAGAMGIVAADTTDQAEKLALCPGSQQYFDEIGASGSEGSTPEGSGAAESTAATSETTEPAD